MDGDITYKVPSEDPTVFQDNLDSSDDVKNYDSNDVNKDIDLLDVTKLNKAQYIDLVFTLNKEQLKKVKIYDAATHCVDLAKMLQQVQPYGFVPLSDLKYKHSRSQMSSSHTDICLDPITLHSLVEQHKCPNFMGARIRVNHEFNCDLFDQLLDGYWDWQISQFMRYGFPMDFGGETSQLYVDRWAHPSAIDYEEHVITYLKEECEYKALIGPYWSPPFGKNSHVSLHNQT